MNTYHGGATLQHDDRKLRPASYQQALLADRELGDCAGEAAVLGNLGMGYHALDHTQAIALHGQGFAIAHEPGDFQRARERTLLAWLVMESIEHPDIATATRLLGYLYRTVGAGDFEAVLVTVCAVQQLDSGQVQQLLGERRIYRPHTNEPLRPAQAVISALACPLFQIK